MAELSEVKRARVAAIAAETPSAVSFRIAESAGFFAHVAPFVRERRPSQARRGGEIAQAVLCPIWVATASRFAPEAARALVEAWIAASLGGSEGELAAASSRARREAGQALRDVLAEGGEDRRWLDSLIGVRGFSEDLAAAAALLVCGEDVETALAAWPALIKTLDEARLDELRALHDALVAETPEMGPILLLIVARRLARPAQILRAVTRISRHTHDFQVEAADIALVGDALIDEAEALQAAFASPPRSGFDPEPLLRALERFAHIVCGMPQEFEIRREGRWGRRLYAMRGQAADRLEAYCHRAVEAVAAVTPRQEQGLLMPELSEPLSPDHLAEACAYGHFLKGTGMLDQHAGFVRARAQALKACVDRLDKQTDLLIGLAQNSDAVSRAAARSHLEALAALVDILHGPAAGAVLRRRIAAAA